MNHDKPDIDAPLPLEIAARLAYPAGDMTANGLRRLGKNGRLAIETVSRKQFTTLRAIEEMREKCRVGPTEPACGLGQHSKAKTASPAKPSGLSETARASAALAALQKTARGLKKSSRTTSPKSTAAPPVNATVIPLKST